MKGNEGVEGLIYSVLADSKEVECSTWVTFGHGREIKTEGIRKKPNTFCKDAIRFRMDGE
jgi:hypothetical protein